MKQTILPDYFQSQTDKLYRNAPCAPNLIYTQRNAQGILGIFRYTFRYRQFITLPVTLKLVPCMTTTRGWHLVEQIEGLRWRLSLAHTFIQLIQQVFNGIQVRLFGRHGSTLMLFCSRQSIVTRAVCSLALSCWNNSLCRSIKCMR